MTAREQLDAILDSDDYGLSHAELTALRELDQLLSECQETLLIWIDEKPVYELIIRLAQAGYGEK